ncbi:TetR family transcriptional regulator [Rhodobacteraceae bacterium RKSG542]|uniref:TetR family transcriptional regulator C-terminal domain-containing protein n=1 Tax=Pseudovibrio flavus TaxID=2529854 RepID=UPI0012BBB862|nr:TetR family transcriptional regulator C-terminal domain-containing protein [Pseudovibrio flavus]MTI16117.1 TetR family transcriptional regulator [Pseudovibrio flavus]
MELALKVRRKGQKNKPEEAGASPSRIQERNRARIIEGALSCFSSKGFKGATVEQIAEAAGMSKSNMLYYYRNKKALYEAVLATILERWLEPLNQLDPSDDPETALKAYISEKLMLARDEPQASRLFAGEVMQGAPVIAKILSGPLKELVADKAATLQKWMEEGRLKAVDPVHFIFMIWAVTQHYADFDTQIRAVTGNSVADEDFASKAEATLHTVLLQGALK